MKTYWQRIKTIVGPSLTKDFDEIGQKKTRSAIERFILSNSNPKTTLLDAGCNTGVEAYRLFEKGYEGDYAGVDSNEKAIRLAKVNLKGKRRFSFAAGDLTKLNFKDKQCDIVLLKDVIEHHKSYETILPELTRVTKTWFILSMFIKPSRFFGDKITLHPDGYYLNKYNRRRLIDFMMKRGFRKPTIIYRDFQDEVFVFRRK